MEFKDVIRSEEELRALMGDPVAPAVVDKTLSTLDRHCRTFIARSPFVLVATGTGMVPSLPMASGGFSTL